MCTFRQFWEPLTQIYPQGEAQAIARLVMELHFGLSMSDVLTGAVEQLPSEELKGLLDRLLEGEPVQYVLGESEFFGRRFHVEPGVLIPRPETEELCRWVIASNSPLIPQPSPLTILDIGTGSGCIACTLAAELQNTEVTAWDISADALHIAAENAKRTHVHVTFRQVDVLNCEGHTLTPFTPHPWNIIVSNPPYVCEKERKEMEPHVLEHEPYQALFVPDDDPLLFYRAIASYARQNLKPHGTLFFELNPLYANDVSELLNTQGFTHTETRKDQFDKVRFIKTCK